MQSGTVDHRITDISRLSMYRRIVAFPRRITLAVVTGFWALMIMVLITAFSINLRNGAPAYTDLGALIEEMFLGSREEALVSLAFGASIAVFMYLASRGSRVAIVLVLLPLAFVLGSGVVAKLLRIPDDYGRLPLPVSVDDLAKYDYDGDIRLVGLRIGGLLVLAIMIVVLARLLRPYWPRRTAAGPSDIRLIFAGPPRFALIARTLGLWLRRPLRLDVLLQAIVATLLFLPAMLVMAYAVSAPFLWSTLPDIDYALLHLFAAWGLENLAAIYALELALFALALAAARLLLGVSKLFLFLSDRALVASAMRIRAVDQRRPVLYLRSFRNDRLPATDPRERGVIALFDPYRESSTLEALLVRRCHAVGPVVAIADPKAWLTPVGAARQHASDDAWRDVVTDYMNEAQRVVVLMDFTENLKWEIERLREGAHVSKTWLVFPPAGNEADYRAMLAVATHAAFPGQPDPLTALDPGLRVLALAGSGSGASIIVSRTATFADYDIALQLLTQHSQ